MGCVSTPYTVEQSVPRTNLNGKTVIGKVVMTGRSLAILPIIDAGIYNAVLLGTKAEWESLQSRKTEALSKHISDFYAETFGVEIAEVEISAEDEAKVSNSSSPENETKQYITNVCAENNAEFFVGMTGQLCTTKVAIFGVNGSNYLKVNIAIYDKTGNEIARGNASTPIQTIAAKDVVAFSTLFDIVEIYLEELLIHMAS
jgi:hypothetical protein